MSTSMMMSLSSSYNHGVLPNPPTLIEYGPCRFVVMDAPSEGNLSAYIRELQRLGVLHLVRVCEPTYDQARVEREGIHVHDWQFPDGEGPPPAIVQQWLLLVRDTFFSSPDDDGNRHDDATIDDDGNRGDSADETGRVSGRRAGPSIGVHCVAGLGRAPVLVAIALIEQGMAPLDAVQFVRERRRGAINSRQLKFLETYRPRGNVGWWQSSNKDPDAASRANNGTLKREGRCLLQ
jgi:protein tyrosine phosphatase type 4A